MSAIMSVEDTVIAAIRRILKRQGFPETEVALDSKLYGEGIGLDSMSVAELSAALEKTYGKDPYTSGEDPQSVRDIVEFYERSAA